MSWFPYPESLKKRAVRYLLDHYLGAFLKDRISVSQLHIDIYSGKASVCDLQLDCDEINDKISAGADGQIFEIVSGHIGQINIQVPWSEMFQKSCTIELVDLSFELALCKPEECEMDQAAAQKKAFQLAGSMCSSMGWDRTG